MEWVGMFSYPVGRQKSRRLGLGQGRLVKRGHPGGGRVAGVGGRASANRVFALLGVSDVAFASWCGGEGGH